VKLPPVIPLKENYLCSNKEEFAGLMGETVEVSGGGAFFKVFGKVGGKAYYATMLVDNRKILAIEVRDVESGEALMGEVALDRLREMLDSGPVIVDTFPLSDVDVKMSIVDNIDVYNATPKMSLDELCPPAPGPVTDASERVEKPREGGSEEIPVANQKPKKKLKLVVNAPPNIEPYLRPFGNRISKYVKSLGVDISALGIEAKEVRYALGAGVGVHINVRIEGKINSDIDRRNLKETIESFLYREASDLSEEIGKKVVIRGVELRF